MILLIQRSDAQNTPLPNGPQVIYESEEYLDIFKLDMFKTHFLKGTISILRKNNGIPTRGYATLKSKNYTYYLICDTDVMDSRSTDGYGNPENSDIRTNFYVIKRAIKSWRRDKLINGILE